MAQLFQPFLVPDAKPLLFVHNEQRQVGENDILRKEAVSTDQNVDLSGGKILKDSFRLLRTPEAADQFNPNREGSKTALECLVMLEGQNRCRRQNGHLLPVSQSFEGGPHGHFGLAESDI